MRINVEIRVNIERADGTETTIREERTDHAGDNPRYEGDEVTKTVAALVEQTMYRFPKHP